MDLEFIATAKQNEKIFRMILQDLENNGNIRPLGNFIPKKFGLEKEIEEIAKIFSKGKNLFNITSFEVRNNSAYIGYQFVDYEPGKGGEGFELRYKINQDSVNYSGVSMDWKLIT